MRPPVYPRWRGELIVHINNRGEFNGLSPLARGTHYGPGKKRAGGRFIPAGAGNSGRLAFQPAPAAVYPRWRGELSVFGITFGFGCGLSPLARGTLRERIAARLRKRFIPAGAGNSLKVYICS